MNIYFLEAWKLLGLKKLAAGAIFEVVLQESPVGIYAKHIVRTSKREKHAGLSGQYELQSETD